VKVANCGTLVDAGSISSAKPLDAFAISDVTGRSNKGILLANMTGVELKNIALTGVAGPILTIQNVTGSGLESAVIRPPATAPAGR
jgi:hypothetical protein